MLSSFGPMWIVWPQSSLTWKLGIRIYQSNLVTFFNPLLWAQLRWGIGSWMPLWEWLSKRMWKTTFFKLSRLEQEEKKCIFVDSEDNVGKIRHRTRRSLFHLGFPFSFLRESWVFFGNVTPRFSSSSWVTWEECVRRREARRRRRRGGTWGSEEERWSLTGPKLSVRLEHDTWDSAGGCTNKAAVRIPTTYSALTETLFEIPPCH